MEVTYKLHEFPVGWGEVIACTIIRHDLYLDIWTATDVELATRTLITLACGNDRILDHWGATDDSLVCEPYGDHKSEAMDLARFFGVTLILGEHPEWHTGCSRYRFEMMSRTCEKPDAATLLAEIIDAANWEFQKRCQEQDRKESLQKSLRTGCSN